MCVEADVRARERLRRAVVRIGYDPDQDAANVRIADVPSIVVRVGVRAEPAAACPSRARCVDARQSVFGPREGFDGELAARRDVRALADGRRGIVVDVHPGIGLGQLDEPASGGGCIGGGRLSVLRQHGAVPAGCYDGAIADGGGGFPVYVDRGDGVAPGDEAAVSVAGRARHVAQGPGVNVHLSAGGDQLGVDVGLDRGAERDVGLGALVTDESAGRARCRGAGPSVAGRWRKEGQRHATRAEEAVSAARLRGQIDAQLVRARGGRQVECRGYHGVRARHAARVQCDDAAAGRVLQLEGARGCVGDVVRVAIRQRRDRRVRRPRESVGHELIGQVVLLRDQGDGAPAHGRLQLDLVAPDPDDEVVTPVTEAADATSVRQSVAVHVPGVVVVDDFVPVGETVTRQVDVVGAGSVRGLVVERTVGRNGDVHGRAAELSGLRHAVDNGLPVREAVRIGRRDRVTGDDGRFEVRLRVCQGLRADELDGRRIKHPHVVGAPVGQPAHIRVAAVAVDDAVPCVQVVRPRRSDSLGRAVYFGCIEGSAQLDGVSVNDQNGVVFAVVQAVYGRVPSAVVDDLLGVAEPMVAQRDRIGARVNVGGGLERVVGRRVDLAGRRLHGNVPSGNNGRSDSDVALDGGLNLYVGDGVADVHTAAGVALCVRVGVECGLRQNVNAAGDLDAGAASNVRPGGRQHERVRARAVDADRASAGRLREGHGHIGRQCLDGQGVGDDRRGVEIGLGLPAGRSSGANGAGCDAAVCLRVAVCVGVVGCG